MQRIKKTCILNILEQVSVPDSPHTTKEARTSRAGGGQPRGFKKQTHFYTEWLRLIDATPLVMMNPFNKSQELLSNNRMQRHKHTQTHTQNGGWGTGRTAAWGDHPERRWGAGWDQKELSSGSVCSRKIDFCLLGLRGGTLKHGCQWRLRWHGETKS